MPGKPSMNGVVERQNRTLLDMVKSIGCPAEDRPYRPNERKLDSKIVSCYFVGYLEHSRGFKFYDPKIHSFFGTENARFLEDVEFGGEGLRNISLDKIVTEE
ncbi:hypothetical protein V2J09_000737 [Rumex salicifolius]